MSSSPFASEIKKAKSLEARLENKIQRYSALAQKINADLLCDEENPLIESNDEKVTNHAIYMSHRYYVVKCLPFIHFHAGFVVRY